MKINSLFHISIFLLTLLIFSMPFAALAQQYSVQAAAATAERDAQANTDPSFWFIIGCFGNVLGLIYANYATPSPPAVRLIGKSPEYVAVYSDAFKKKSKELQTNLAVRGCIANFIVAAVCSGCGIVLSASE